MSLGNYTRLEALRAAVLIALRCRQPCLALAWSVCVTAGFILY